VGNLTEFFHTFAPRAHTDSTRFNKTIIRAIREIRGKKPATNYHKFPQIIQQRKIGTPVEKLDVRIIQTKPPTSCQFFQNT